MLSGVLQSSRCSITRLMSLHTACQMIPFLGTPKDNGILAHLVVLQFVQFKEASVDYLRKIYGNMQALCKVLYCILLYLLHVDNV